MPPPICSLIFTQTEGLEDLSQPGQLIPHLSLIFDQNPTKQVIFLTGAQYMPWSFMLIYETRKALYTERNIDSGIKHWQDATVD